MTVMDSVYSLVTWGKGEGEKKMASVKVQRHKKITNGNKVTSLAARQGLPFAPDKQIG